MRIKNLNAIIVYIIVAVITSLFIGGCKKISDIKTAVPKDTTIIIHPPTTPPTNDPVITTPAIGSIYPLSALPNSVISIKGSNLDTVLVKSYVTVNGTPAVISSISATDVEFTVPLTAATGKIVLVNNGKTLTSASDFVVTSFSNQILYANTIGLSLIAIDNNDLIYGSTTHSVYRIDKNGTSTSLGFVQGFYTSITGLAVDGAGNIFLASRMNRKLIKVTAAGVPDNFSFNLAGPSGLAIDSVGNMYTTENHQVKKITPGGAVTVIAGTGADGKIDGRLDVLKPTVTFGDLSQIAIDKQGNIFVSDSKYFISGKDLNCIFGVNTFTYKININS